MVAHGNDRAPRLPIPLLWSEHWGVAEPSSERAARAPRRQAYPSVRPRQMEPHGFWAKSRTLLLVAFGGYQVDRYHLDKAGERGDDGNAQNLAQAVA
jgi:hypothetical protein